MFSFQFQFDDYDEAETTLAAFAETCRQLKATLKKRPSSAAVGKLAAETLPSAPQPAAEENPGARKADEELKKFLDEESAKSNETAPRKPRQTKAQKSEAAKMADAVNSPPNESNTPAQPATTEKKTVTVSGSALTLDDLRAQVAVLTKDRSKGGVMKVAEILKSFNVQRLPELKEEDYPNVSRLLSEAITGDQVPHTE